MLYENLANEFATLIGNGQIRPGDRLPSVRHLARQRSLSISTVVQALRTLESRGMVEARPQSGYYVRRRPARMVEATTLAGAPAPEPVDVGVSRRLVQVLRANEAPGMVRLLQHEIRGGEGVRVQPAAQPPVRDRPGPYARQREQLLVARAAKGERAARERRGQSLQRADAAARHADAVEIELAQLRRRG